MTRPPPPRPTSHLWRWDGTPASQVAAPEIRPRLLGSHGVAGAQLCWHTAKANKYLLKECWPRKGNEMVTEISFGICIWALSSVFRKALFQDLRTPEEENEADGRVLDPKRPERTSTLQTRWVWPALCRWEH